MRAALHVARLVVASTFGEAYAFHTGGPQQRGPEASQADWEDNMRPSLWTALLGVVAFAPGVRADMTLPEIKKQPNAAAVLAEHFDALNHCDWNRIVAQYPEDAEIHLSGGRVLKGRAVIGEMFAILCKDPKDGGMNGIMFKPEHSMTIGDTFAVQWIATAPFLAEPYRGSDAYITKDGLMQAMVTTFDGSALKLKR